MSFRLTFFPDVPGKTIDHDGDREAAICAAGKELLRRKAISVRVINIDGSAAEVCCLRSDGSGAYTRDDKP